MADREGNVLLPPGGITQKAEVRGDEILYSYAHLTQKGVTLASGQGVLAAGTVLARNPSTKKYGPYAPGNAEEVQTLNLGAASAGTFTISFDGETTSAIAYNASAATVQTALEALSNVSPGDVTVTGGPAPATLTFTFGGRYVNTNVPAITVGSGSLTGGTVTVNTSTPGSSGSGNYSTAVGILRNSVDTNSGDRLANIVLGGVVKYAKIVGLDDAAIATLNGRVETTFGFFDF